MALIKCPECKKEISDKASSCPNCGFLVKNAKADGTVRIKMPGVHTEDTALRLIIFVVIIVGIPITFGFSILPGMLFFLLSDQWMSCTIYDQETKKIYWKGKKGGIAEFYLPGPTDITVKFGLLGKPLYYTVDPRGNPMYSISQNGIFNKVDFTSVTQ